MTQLSELTQQVLQFRDQREWSQFHTPSHLVAALSIEAAELQELFLWKSDDEIASWLEDGGRTELKAELADVLIYLLLLSHECDLALDRAVREKFRENAVRYPVDLAKGSPRKYTELQDTEGEEG